jgi:hypothetical protein
MSDNKIQTNETNLENFETTVIDLAQRGGDEGDCSSLIESYERDQALKNHLQSNRRTLPHDFDGFCVECGEEVPEVRIKLGFDNCVSCQELKELRARRR